MSTMDQNISDIYLEQRDSRARPRVLFNAHTPFDIFAAATAALPAGWISKRDGKVPLQLNRLNLTFEGLPPNLDGFSILHLSDLHFDGSYEVANRLRSCVQGSNVDLVVMTGDYHGKRHGDVWTPLIASQIQEILKCVNAKHQAVAILGDHDTSQVVKEFRLSGIHTLINQTTLINHKGVPNLQILGTEDTSWYMQDLGKLDREVLSPNRPTKNIFGLVLSHTANAAHLASDRGYHLYLSGHTHGGQWCFPDGKPLVNLLTNNRECIAGIQKFKGMYTYTSRGVGTSILPVRINCPAEATILTLKLG